MKLCIKYPTRNRPEQFKALMGKYISLLSGKHAVEFILSMDNDDPTMNNLGMANWLEAFSVAVVAKHPAVCINWYYGVSKNKVEACNANMENISGDVLMMIADDMMPLVKDYDDIILTRFAAEIPDGMGALKFWDGLRNKNDDLMCLQIIGVPLFKKIGHFFHPSYESVFCDDELTAVCKQLGKFVRDDRCIIRHEWNRSHFDYVREKSENRETKNRDMMRFLDRKKINFDLPLPG